MLAAPMRVPRSRLRAQVYFTTLGEGVRHAQAIPEEEGKEVMGVGISLRTMS